MTEKEMYRNMQSGGLGNGCGPTLMYGMLLLWIVLCLTGCRSVKSVESTADSRISAELTSRMDSLLRATATWQQSIYKQQTQLTDSFKHSEVRDTSHTIFLGAKGDTVRERIVIKEYIEREHQTAEKSETFLEEKFRQTDSLLQVCIAKQEKTDSLLRDHEKTAVVEKELSLWERIKQDYGGAALFVCVTCFVVLLYKLYTYLRRKVPLKR